MLSVSEIQPLPPEQHGVRFDALFQRLYPRLLGLAHRVLGDRAEAEDILQDAFLKLADSSVVFRPDDEVAAWMRRVCLNLSINRLRGQRRAQERLSRAGRMQLADWDGGDQAEDGGQAVVIRQEQQHAVQDALLHLPSQQRDCLLLRYSGCAYAEIAATLTIAPGSVGALLTRAESAFRHHYQYQEADES